jgi:hypothetical protein
MPITLSTEKKALSAPTSAGHSPHVSITRSTMGSNDSLSLGACVVRWATIKWSSLTARSTV